MIKAIRYGKAVDMAGWGLVVNILLSVLSIIYVKGYIVMSKFCFIHCLDLDSIFILRRDGAPVVCQMLRISL